MQKTTRAFTRYTTRGVLTAIACLLGVAFALPLLWMIASAFRPQDEIFRFLSPLSLNALLPTRITFDNFNNLLNGPFLDTLGNSLLVAAATIVLGLIVSTLAAFALSITRFRFREVIFGIVIISALIPFEAISIPLSDLFRTWQLRDTYAGLILPGLANGMAIFLLRQFFLGIPEELKEAAQVDGANLLTILLKIYIPLARPALIGAGLIFFVGQWQAFLWPLLVVSQPQMNLAPVQLAQFLGQYSFDFGTLFAGALMLSVIPMLVVLPLQRYFIQSVATTGSK
ncbi:MAG: carbohydrate ABC transporter permease [Ktedonobacteraceae bacterium]|nr:carbohydrate ABC transporter permease [Ktedonobacteraceae bacterium]